MSAPNYTLTPEHEALLPGWRDQWVGHALSTASIRPDWAEIVSAVQDLYRAADLAAPPPEKVIYVPSPMVLRFAGGYAAALTYLRKQGEALPGVITVPQAALTDRPLQAALLAIEQATGITLDVRGDAALDLKAKNPNAWFTGHAALVALGHQDAFWLECASKAFNMWNGGNQWAGYPAFLSFFRQVVKLDLDYTKWIPYETLARLAGPRIMHPEFCLVSDRPSTLRVDGEQRPHRDDGPFCEWRDGTALYSVRGVRVPWWLIEQPARLTLEVIQAEENAEVKRVMLERFGFLRYLDELGAAPIDMSEAGTLYRVDQGEDEPLVVVEVINRTPEVLAPGEDPLARGLVRTDLGWCKRYVLRVPPTTTTAKEAVAWTFGLRPEEYQPTQES